VSFILFYKYNNTYILIYQSPLVRNSPASPISVTLNATNNEESPAIKLALRCESGYQTTGDVIVELVGSTALNGHLPRIMREWPEPSEISR